VKLRQGFVSNSSSCSWYIRTPNAWNKEFWQRRLSNGMTLTEFIGMVIARSLTHASYGIQDEYNIKAELHDMLDSAEELEKTGGIYKSEDLEVCMDKESLDWQKAFSKSFLSFIESHSNWKRCFWNINVEVKHTDVVDLVKEMISFSEVDLILEFGACGCVKHSEIDGITVDRCNCIS